MITIFIQLVLFFDPHYYTYSLVDQEKLTY